MTLVASRLDDTRFVCLCMVALADVTVCFTGNDVWECCDIASAEYTCLNVFPYLAM